MSLLGRLEDLSLTDIIQIVFLSRRTGILEILNSRGRHTVLFHHGLVVNASSPDNPDLAAQLERETVIDAEGAGALREMEKGGGVVGDSLLESGVLTPGQLATLIQQRVQEIVSPLLANKEGEFNFLLSEGLGKSEIGYDSDSLFREGGIAPHMILGTESEKVKPLQGLEESMRVGKALLRGATPPSPEPMPPAGGLIPAATSVDAPESPQAPPAPRSELPFAEVEDDVFVPDRDLLDEELMGWRDKPTPDEQTANVVRFPSREGLPETEADQGSLEDLTSLLPELEPDFESLRDEPLPEPDPDTVEEERSGSRSGAEFRVVGELPEIPDADRNVVVLERNPLVRVAAKRAFGRKGIRIFQFGSIDDARHAIQVLLRENRFFVTFLELGSAGGEGDPEVSLLQLVKKKNRHLPVVVIDREADLRRRHGLLEVGADLYLTKPSPGHLQAGLAEQALALFADELVLFAEHAFFDWQQLTGALTDSGGGEIGRKFYDIAEKEKLNRSLAVVRQLINELSDPDDINQVAQTVLRLSQEYLDRGALFAVTHRQFIGLGGFGSTGDDREMNGVARRIRIRKDETSVLHEVSQSQQPHRGKIRRSPANVKLIETLGPLQPTEVVVLPIVQEGRVLGVLYGDNAENRSPIDPTSGLELFLSQAAFALENAIIANVHRHGQDWE